MKNIKQNIINPNAAVIIWNYEERTDSDETNQPHDIDTVIAGTSSVISIATTKAKSSPAGQFEIVFAPNANWISKITPGSWCAILMSRDSSIQPFTSSNPGEADEKTLKMFGRIHSIRMMVQVDPQTGTRQTLYIANGEDWSSVFNTTIYVDPIVRTGNFETTTAIGHAARFVYESLLLQWTKDGRILPSPKDALQGIIKLWGSPIAETEQSIRSRAREAQPQTELVTTSSAQFKLPNQVAKFFKFKTDLKKDSVCFGDLIQIIDGKLESKDKYKPVNDGAGILNPMSIYGTNTFWQLLIDNCNPVINELITDIRWENNRPVLALYKRIKPFANRERFRNKDHVKDIVSLFKNIKHVDIPYEEVISIDIGTNWKDKINFIELKPQQQLNQTNLSAMVKLDSQTVDLKAIERDGFKPLTQNVNYLIYDNKNSAAPLEVVRWKALLREWYFNTHNMLNGALTVVGQNKYIQVGDNIRINAKIFGNANFSKEQSDYNGDTYLLAHVESVSNNFTIDANGSRSYTTSINFVRGVIVDPNDNVLAGFKPGISGTKAIDKKASNQNNKDRKNRNTIITPTVSDPNKEPDRGK